MDTSIGKWLVDIINCINEIDIFFEGKERNYEAYGKNILLKRGIERNLEIIGEAINRILHKDGISKYQAPGKLSNFVIL